MALVIGVYVVLVVGVVGDVVGRVEARRVTDVRTHLCILIYIEH